jgi:DNA-directed RNA polymerase subunit RPC12/RpoP
MNSSAPAVDDLLQQGITAARTGDEAQARRLLTHIVTQDERNATAWLWLSSVVDNFADLEVCLENAAILQPDNALIRQRLDWVKQQQAAVLPNLDEKNAVTQARAAMKAQPAAQPVFTATQPGELEVQRQFSCPKCAGRLRFNPEIVDLQCQSCGYVEVVAEIPAQLSERVLSKVLRTQRGYRWASVERLLRCQQCGAQTVFPPAQTSVSCPYCGSSVFGTAPEDQELETPQALIPMGLEADTARRRVAAWLGRGWLAPDDLQRALLHGLQAVYVPLWLFNSATTLRPPGREQQVYLYANWAVSGIRSLPARLIKGLGEVNTQNLVEFKPEYLAGWSASTYDVSAALAAQQARAEIGEDARRRASRLPLDTSFISVSFSTDSFWLVLFPIWIANYTYRKKIYRVLVNGETGQVAGDKPISRGKALAVIAVIITLLGLLGFMLLRTLSAMALPTELPPILDALKPVSILLVPIIIALIAMVVLAFRE